MGDTLNASDATFAVDGVPTGNGGADLPAGLSLDGNTLSLDPSDPAYNALSVGDQATITVAYTIADSHGATVAQTATLTIHSANDAPSVAGPLIGSADESGKDILIGGAGDDILNGGAGKDMFRYMSNQLGVDDLLAGAHDVIKATKGDIIEFNSAVWAELRKDGSPLAGRSALADHLSEGSNIAYDGHSLLIDANGDGQFQADQDLSIDIVGVHKIAVDASGAFLSVG